MAKQGEAYEKNYEVFLGVLIVVMCSLAAWVSWPGNTERWQTLRQNSLVKIEAEKAIYSKINGDRFYLRLRVTNRTLRTVGIDTSTHKFFIYGSMVSEGTPLSTFGPGGIMPLALGCGPDTQYHKNWEKDFKRLFHKSQLRQISPHQSIDVYLSPNRPNLPLNKVNQSLPAKALSASGPEKYKPHIIVEIQGSTSAADGTIVETEIWEWQELSVPYPTPSRIKLLPAKALILPAPK